MTTTILFFQSGQERVLFVDNIRSGAEAEEFARKQLARKDWILVNVLQEENISEAHYLSTETLHEIELKLSNSVVQDIKEIRKISKLSFKELMRISFSLAAIYIGAYKKGNKIAIQNNRGELIKIFIDPKKIRN